MQPPKPLTIAVGDTEVKDFSPDSTIADCPPHVHYDVEATAGAEPVLARTTSAQSHDTSNLPSSPILKRRRTRVGTEKSFREDISSSRTEWQPGQEPGLDPSKDNGGRATTPTLHQECQITVVDFSEKNLEMHEFDNAGLINFVEQKQEEWIKCRWISVNGLSWDVIQALGKYKKLHRLAIEDMLSTHNRTKADWYVIIG